METETSTDHESKHPRYDELKAAGANVLATVRALVHEGNYRRIIVRNEQGRTLLEIPLTLGLVVTVLKPLEATIGALTAMAGGFTILVERPHDPEPRP